MTFQNVSWQPDDEVTSQKLQQMSSNTEWVKDKLILGDAIRVSNGDNTPSPHEVGTSKILRIDAVAKPFNSQTETAWMDINVGIPDGYSNVPFALPTVTDPHKRGYYVNVVGISGLTNIQLRITQADHIAKVLSGLLQVVFIGY